MDNKWIKVEAGVYELANDRSIFIIHWSKMHPEPPEYPEDTWELYQHEGGDNNFWDSGRTLTELKPFGERVQRENFAKKPIDRITQHWASSLTESGKQMMDNKWRSCEVCERDQWDVGKISHTAFNTWECEPCHEQSLRLTYGEDKYPFGGGTERYVHGNKL